jgi:hydrogenase nickel incorporation protein HypA/HybF
MHEMSLAISLIEMASEEAARLAPERIEVLHVRIGVLSAIVPDALRFSFEVAAAGTPLEGAQLAIEEVPLIISCDRCAAEMPAEAPLCICPCCGGPGAIVSGREIELRALEVRAP